MAHDDVRCVSVHLPLEGLPFLEGGKSLVELAFLQTERIVPSARSRAPHVTNRTIRQHDRPECKAVRRIMPVVVSSLQIVILHPTGPPQCAVEEPKTVRTLARDPTFAGRNDNNRAGWLTLFRYKSDVVVQLF